MPQDYTTIQAAIDASADGDTVLVSGGTYYENIRYRGKAITVGSLYLTDGDTAHVAATIIDGSMHTHPDSGSVVYFIDGEDTTSVLCGMTIRGGSGTLHDFLGIPYREGGGVYANGASPRIAGNLITRNRIHSQQAAGGGVSAMTFAAVLPLLVLEGNRIIDNLVEGWDTTYGTVGGGVAVAGVHLRLLENTFERDTVIAHRQANGGGLFIQAIDSGYPFPAGLISRNTFRHNVIHASTHGAVGGGMTAIWTGDMTIQENSFEANDGTSVLGWAEGGGLCVTDENAHGYGRKTITGNRFLTNSVTHGGSSTLSGGGVLVYRTLASMDGNEVRGNSASAGGGGVAIYRSSFRVVNNIIMENSTGGSGAGVLISYAPQIGAEQLMMQNTIVANQSSYSAGGVSVSGSGASVEILNNIIWGNTALFYPQIFIQPPTGRVNYCDVQGGWTGIGNLDSDPLFTVGGYDLAVGSPCLGAGRDTITLLPATDFHGNPRPNPAGSRPDIGACDPLAPHPPSLSGSYR